MFDKYKMVRAEDLRIVKLYNITKLDTNEAGDIEGIETAKVAPYFVLVKKDGAHKFSLVKTPKLDLEGQIYENVGELHQLVVNKTRYNNRYRKPIHLCQELQGHKFTQEQLEIFAENVEGISAEQPAKYAESQLKKVCELAYEHFFADELSL